MTREKFYQVVEEAIPQLPVEFQEVLDNIEIVVRNRPDKMTRARLKPGTTLLGLYSGIPRTVRGAGYSIGFYSFAPPDRIFLFQKNIEQFCQMTGKSVVAQIKETLFHEIGHFLGLGEAELEDLKYRSIIESDK